MKLEKLIFGIAISIFIIITVSLTFMLNVKDNDNEASMEEIEASALAYIDAVEKYSHLSRYDNNIDVIENRSYSVKEFNKLDLDFEGKYPDDTGIFSIDVYGKVSQGWFTYGEKYKVYYSMANQKATASTTGDYLDEYGNKHNRIVAFSK